MSGFDNEVMFASGERLEPSSAQSIGLMQQEATDVARINYAGNPEGVISSNPSSLCHDPVSGNVYLKQSGTGNTGWQQVVGNAIKQINGDTGSITGSTATIFSNTATRNCGSTVSFSNTSTTSTFNVSDAGNNTLIGKLSGNATLSGTLNTSLGVNNLQALTSGTYNCAFGVNALQSCTSGSQNHAFGFQASNQLTTASYNLAVGYQALFRNNGSENVALGYIAMNSCSGNQNVAIGSNCYAANAGGTQSGSLNTFVGRASAGYIGGTASSNSGFGANSLYGISNGAANTCLGVSSGYTIRTGSYNTCVGYNSGFSYNDAESSNVLISNAGVLGESNKIRIGTQGTGNGQQNECYVAGINGNTVSNARAVTINSSTHQLGTSHISPVIQQVRSTLDTIVNCSTIIPYDNSIPLSGEGDEVMTVAITPTNASSILVVEWNGFVGTSTYIQATAALFQDSNTNASFATSSTIQDTALGMSISFRFVMTAGTTSSTTFRVRLGPNNTGTITLNGNNSGRLFGGVSQSVLTVTEYSV